MSKPKIHFICRANVFRSRLAEAYARSIDQDESFDFSSSGVNPELWPNGEITEDAKAIATKHGLGGLFSQKQQQTTSDLLKDKEIIVFMRDDVYHDARQRFSFDDTKALVWDVNDIENWPRKMSTLQIQQATFQQISHLVDELINGIRRAGWTDIFDESNRPLHYRLPVIMANQKQVWHRGCHVVITAPEGKTLVQKRSKTIVFAPSLLDITLGGHVDDGETPHAAIKREIAEEIGINVPAEALQLINVHRWNAYHPHYKTRTKVFLYTYRLQLSALPERLNIQTKEVAWADFVTQRQLNRLLRTHRLKHLGRLNYAYSYYRHMVDLAHA